MFGNVGGQDPLDNVAHFRRERTLAHEKWPFLTEDILRGINTGKQLTAAVYALSQLSLAEADAEVEEWLKSHDVRVLKSSLMRRPKGPKF